MALQRLYPEERKLTKSDLCFNKGVVEIGGPKKIASLSLLQEERPKMVEGINQFGRVREGIVVVPANYFPGGNSTAYRGIASRGLPLLSPDEATALNSKGEWYSPDEQRFAEEILFTLRGLVPIDERDVKENKLELLLPEFLDNFSKYTFPLFGGEGTEEQRTVRVRNAEEYFRRELDKAGKSKKRSIDLHLAPLDSVRQAREKIVGTQIWAGGLDVEFSLPGDDRDLNYGGSVFGVSD